MYGQYELKSKIEMMRYRAFFHKKRMKAAPAENSFRRMVFAGNAGTGKTMAARCMLVIIIQFKQYVFSFSFGKKGKC